MMAKEIEYFRSGNFLYGMRKESMDGFYCQRVFCGDEVVECSGLKTLEPTAKDMLSCRPLSEIVTEYEAEKRAAACKPQKRLRAMSDQ